MTDITQFLHWLIIYAVSDGFWHFAAVYLVAVVISRIFAFVRVNITMKRGKEKKDTK